MFPCATQDFRNAVAEFDYVFSRIPRNSVPVRTMGGPRRPPLSLIACELFEDGREAPDPPLETTGRGLVICTGQFRSACCRQGDREPSQDRVLSQICPRPQAPKVEALPLGSDASSWSPRQAKCSAGEFCPTALTDPSLPSSL
jgi:hypothetical protein